MIAVWKYQVDPVARPELVMVRGAQILEVAGQNGVLCLWALVDPEEQERTRRHFRLVGTGEEVEIGEVEYVGTAHFSDQRLIFHLFEDGTP